MPTRIKTTTEVLNEQCLTTYGCKAWDTDYGTAQSVYIGDVDAPEPVGTFNFLGQA